MSNYNEHDVQRALGSISHGKSIRGASIESGVPRRTLHNRIQGTQPRAAAFASQQKLSPVQETHIANWIETQAALGHPPTHAQVKDLAERILRERGGPQSLGRNWFQSFTRRNPSIRTQGSKLVGAKQVKGPSLDAVRDWFQRLHIPEIQGIDAANRWNMNEIGLLGGRNSDGLVLGSKEARVLHKTQPKARVWLNFIESVNANGRLLPPLVIYKEHGAQQQWFPRELPEYNDWRFHVAETDWRDSDAVVIWLKEVFIPLTKPTDPMAARLLILDDYEPRRTTELMHLCCVNNIHLASLPPSTCDVLEPLCASVFPIFDWSYRTNLRFLDSWDMASKAGKRDFLACYRTARQLTFSQKNITAAFRTSGQWPVDLTRPLQSPKLREASNQDPSSRGEGTPECDETASTVTWTTPKKSIDVQKQLALFSRLQGSNATQRLLFRKIQKACDEREFELATLKLEYEALKEEVEFARVLSRNRSQMAASSDNHIMGRSNGIGSFAQVEDCVVVSARAVEK